LPLAGWIYFSMGRYRSQIRDQPAQEIVAARPIGGDGDVVDIADTQQALDVRLVRMREEGVGQEDDARDLPDRHARRALRVATERAGEVAVDRQACRLGDETTALAGGDQGEAREERAPCLTEGLQVVFLRSCAIRARVSVRSPGAPRVSAVSSGDG